MFQPRGPNFLLSWMTAWKKENENRSFLQISGLPQSSMKF